METSPGSVASQATTRRLTFLDLPQEVQKDIISQCCQSDLICLSLVSKLFRELAAAQLYRNFHIVFPDEDDPAYESPIDGLASGLDTFVTSDYDYGKHLRDLSLDTLSAGDKAETAYKPYLYSVSCGKFMNTLLHLTLRKAKSLEAFTWNIRVELSRPVFKTLHSITTLKDIHIRLQLGPSLYDIPPPLPLSSQAASLPPPYAQGMDGLVSQAFGESPVTFYPNSVPGQAATPLPQLHKPLSLRSKARKQSPAQEPPTFSQFKKLRSLAVLDMDTLEAVPEIKVCIRNSLTTLTKLKLSFSDHLAAQARNPSADSELDDSDQEDEFQGLAGHSQPPPPHYADGSLGVPARAFRVAEERKIQEAILGRIFDVESSPARKLKRDKTKEIKTPELVDANLTPAEAFINSLMQASTKLHKKINRSSGQGEDLTATQQEVVDLMGAAARKYVAEVGADDFGSPAPDQPGEGASGEPAHVEAGTRPEDDNEEPEGQSNSDGQEILGWGGDTPVNCSSQPAEPKALGEVDYDDRGMSDYIRSTRGLRLQQLSIYLIPVKASVLSRAIDIHALRKITLLNVGSQQSIWALFAKENKTRPLPLRKIFTDNVSPALLNFVSQLDELHEFLILERPHKYKPASFAPKTVITMEQIRKLVLRKHLPTLRRLMIKNMDTQEWDVDEQTIKLICRKGKLLQELAVSMNIRAVHAFMQNMGGLINLIALLIIRLRNEDTCLWVMSETRKFLLDNLSHHPEMKLEWLSVDDDDQLEKVVRIHKAKGDAKGKGKAADGHHDLFPHLSVDSWDGDSSDDSDDDEVRLETIEGVHFYDVWGIKIFQKEVVAGRL